MNPVLASLYGVFKHLKVCHHETVIQIVTSSSESYYILLLAYDENHNHCIRDLADHKGLFSCKIANPRYDVFSQMAKKVKLSL
jgi:hypothetical protein